MEKQWKWLRNTEKVKFSEDLEEENIWTFLHERRGRGV